MTKVNELRVSDYRRVDSVIIRPGAGVVEIVGLNANGKTSILNAIAAALGGKELVPKEPIRRGKDRAEIEVDVGAYRVRRTFTRQEGGGVRSEVAVFAKGGAKQHSPQAFLNERLGDLSFDPMRFAMMKTSDKFDLLKRFVPGVDFAEIDAANRRDYEERTVVNRQAASAKAAAAAITLPDGPPPNADDADMTAIAAELKAAHDHNGEVAARDMRRRRAEQEAMRMEDEAEQLRAKAATLEAEASKLRTKLDEAEPLPPLKEVEAIERRLRAAQQAQETLALFRRREAHIAEAGEAKRESERLTAEMEARNAEAVRAIEAAKLPAGIGLDAAGFVTLGGVPWDQASHREQVAASTAIGMALVPRREDGEELRVVLIDEASGIDADGVAMIERMADNHGFQVWMARLAASGDDVPAFTIEDGRLK